MQQTIPDAGSKIGDVLQSEDVKKILPWLLAGGAGAIAGGAMTGARKRKGRPDEEGRLKYLARVLGNAALAGGLVVGGGKALQYGANRLADAAPAPEGKEPLKSPLSSTLGGIASNPLVALPAGMAGLAASNRTLGSPHTKDIAEARADLETMFGKKIGVLNKMEQPEFDTFRQTQERLGGFKLDPRDAQLAGLRPLDHIQGTGRVADARRMLTRLLNTSGGKAFGATRGARIRRGGMFGAAALAPSLLYNYFASQPQE
jgi:hypothetical protein